MHLTHLTRIAVVLLCLTGSTGCHLLLPEISQQPVIRNPFPQLSRVAVAPFFNHSDEPTVDGRRVAMAYYAELQTIQGFEVVPVGVVEEAIIQNRVNLSGPGEARRLAEILGVDVVVVGSVTDYSPFYPPRVGLRVEWYAANPGFHAIPAGYGLPWNQPEGEFIPEELKYEAQLAQAKAQFAALTPDCSGATYVLPPPPNGMPEPEVMPGPVNTAPERSSVEPVEPVPLEESVPDAFDGGNPLRDRDQWTYLAQALTEPLSDATSEPTSVATDAPATTAPSEFIGATGACVTPECQSRCLMPPQCVPNDGPVMSHTRLYRGNDPYLTSALKGYVYYRDDARFGGWESYLQRTDDFMRFCCHMHLSEMFSARGGAQESRVVTRWPNSR